jgi:hypothetical protein
MGSASERAAAVALVALAACGGKADKDRVVPSDASADEDERAELTCPGEGETAPSDCARVPISLPFVPGAIERSADGITVEALQIPSFTEENRGGFGIQQTRPEDWDRAELPAGACVFRLRGFHASCYAPAHYGDIFVGACDEVQPIWPGSYYDVASCHVAPGCPSATWGNTEGYWWYLAPREDATDLIICAPECAGSFASMGACLRLAPRP